MADQNKISQRVIEIFIFFMFGGTEDVLCSSEVWLNLTVVITDTGAALQ